MKCLTFYLIKNPRKFIKGLAEFLDIECDDALIDDIADKTQFSKHKAAIDDLQREEQTKQSSVDGKNYMYRKGINLEDLK